MVALRKLLYQGTLVEGSNILSSGIKTYSSDTKFGLKFIYFNNLKLGLVGWSQSERV